MSRTEEREDAPWYKCAKRRRGARESAARSLIRRSPQSATVETYDEDEEDEEEDRSLNRQSVGGDELRRILVLVVCKAQTV